MLPPRGCLRSFGLVQHRDTWPEYATLSFLSILTVSNGTCPGNGWLPSNQTCTYTCDTGNIKLFGSGTATCQLGNLIDTPDLRCLGLPCYILLDPEIALGDCPSSRVMTSGQSCTLGCITGYVNVSGSGVGERFGVGGGGGGWALR